MKNGGIRLPSRFFENEPTKPCLSRRLIFDQAVGNTKCIHIFLLQTKEAGAHQGNPYLVPPACNTNFEIASNLNLFCSFVLSNLPEILLFARSDRAT